MRVVIVGAGSLGMVFAALLVRQGHDVVLVGRQKSKNTTQDDTGREGCAQIRLRGCIELEDSIPYTTSAPADADLLLLCTKAIDTPAQLRPLAGLAPHAVLSLQNSIHKNRYLAGAFGKERVLGGATMVSAERRTNGVVLLTSLGTTFVGAPCSAPSDLSTVAEKTAQAFAQAGFPSVVVSNIERLEWTKACFVAGGFTVAALTGLSADRFFTDSDLARVFLSLAREVAVVAAAAGHEVDDFPGLPLHSLLGLSEEEALAALRKVATRFVEAPFPAKPSMLQDLEAGRPLEVEENLGALLHEAARVGVATPRLEMAVRLIRGLASTESRVR
jgi:2-dehydropantoate 2-reductase